MKNRILKYGSKLGVTACMALLVQSCNLDYQNTTAISPDNVWTDKVMINAFLNDIHGSMMPGWPINGNDSDEGFNSRGSMSNYLRGIIDVEGTGQKFEYGNIDKINFFLANLENVSLDVLTETERNQMMGQALFWRAWDYFGKVTTFGGVPLILKSQDIADKESLFMSRNKTSECIAQILKDLDDAIADLPDQWNDDNYGYVDKGIALAFKGKVLMWYASPLFNPGNDQERWKAAYEANKQAVEFLQSVGKGLYEDYTRIWEDEQNKECIMVNQFYYPDHTQSTAHIRPLPFTKDWANQNQPTLSLLLAYPLKDGSTLSLDVNKLLTDKEYNRSFMTDYYMNRDNRFYTTIFLGGTVYPTPDLTGDQRFWSTWYEGDDTYLNMCPKQTGVIIDAGITGCFCLKGLDKSLDKANVANGETDWIEIRYAEVLMNYGECANEIGKTNEALQILYDIRKRAGIESGSGKYGITATTTDGIREVYIKERFVEFAFEGKRWGDLRRLKRFDIVNATKYRSALYPVLNDKKEADNFDWTNDMSDQEVRDKFHLVYIQNLDGEAYSYKLDMNHWFYPINKEGLDRNSKLEQNNEWGGIFDPLQ